MKKFLTTLTLIAVATLLAPAVHAGDCFKDPIYNRDWNAEVTTGAFVRDVACMEGSEVLTTLPVGTIAHVIGETDGWYKIETPDGTIGWVGQWLVEQTSKSFTQTKPEPEEPLLDDMDEILADILEHKYEEAIWYVYYNGIVNGYDDGTYKPDNTLNRAELLKIIVEAAFGDEFEEFANKNCFSDVPSNEWYTKYVCFAKEEGIVEGYPGNLFKPTNEITFVEALKITMVGFNYDFEKSSPWYKDLVIQASEGNFIPLDVTKFNQDFTRGQIADLITRILKSRKGELAEYLGDSADEVVTYKDLN
ncbi:MAG: SH3 domain-containing protein [Nitrospirae bacterium]|nr:SH3 domain-containing protein [Nitrospirota bacterium]